MPLQDLFLRLNNVIVEVERQLCATPETPEEHHSEKNHKAQVWSHMKEQIGEIFYLAYHEIPLDGTSSHASARTALLEQAIREMTEKLIQYPSTPYTFDSTQSLGNTINALKTSMEIDAMNAKEQMR